MMSVYSNQSIYKNLTVVKVLSIISLIVAILIFISSICSSCIKYSNSGTEVDIWEYGYFYFFLLVDLVSIPVMTLIFSTHDYPRWQIAQQERKNDVFHLRVIIVLTFAPYIIGTILNFIAAIFVYKLFNPLFIYDICGYALPSHIFVYVGDIFLIWNIVLIKREWKKEPPKFLIDQNDKNYKSLIEKSGVKFFIKYYKQIKRLPLRDVAVSENYSSQEREERLLAAKKIIDLGLTEFALREIIAEYSDILDSAEIEQAKSLLSELSKK